jgi:predicted Fe-S protein YdhL (DUF1289 family)
MEKSKTIDWLSIPDSEKRKLIEEIRRKIQQRVLQEKLTR